MLGAGRGRGLSELFTGTAQVGDVLSPAANLPRLKVITPGFDTARAASAIEQAGMKLVIDDLLDKAKYVIIEAQSVGENADTFGVARFAEAAIVAVEIGRSRPTDIADCGARLGRLGANVLGTAILPAGPISRRAKSAASAGSPPAPPAPPPDRSYVGSIKRYEMQQDQAAPAAEPAASTPMWTASTPKASGSRPDFTPATATRGPRETMPMPRVKPGEREGYPNPADPATGD
jgi:hypothetical protein